VQVGQTLSFTVTATDADLPANGLTLSTTALRRGDVRYEHGRVQLGADGGPDGRHGDHVHGDGHRTPQLSDSETITLTVTAEANQAPVVNNQSFSLAENSANGTVVGTIAATDPNVGQLLSYALTGTAFAVNTATGQITVATVRC